jgi:general secretion pathway protein D
VRGGLSTGTLSEELRRSGQAPNDGARPGRAGPAGGAGAVVVVPDEVTNSLLVRGTEGDVQAIAQAVEQLDVRPLQVLIEVLIVEARRDRSFSLNANIFVPPQPLDGGTIGGSLQGGGLGDLVIRLLSMGKADVDATIGIAASRGDVDILSRPVLVTSNNSEARFLVGSQRPFVAVSRTLPTDDASRDQVVQYRDVGTKLVVRPTINHDGYVALLIQQEITAATSEVQFDAPVISTREAATQVLVKDGQTILLGGLRDEQKDRVQAGVPILSAIPVLGGLFGSANRRSSATELFLFLTPRILRTDEDVDNLTKERLPEVPE